MSRVVASRVPDHVRQLAEAAADRTEVSLSAFTRRAIEREAVRVLQDGGRRLEHETLEATGRRTTHSRVNR